MNIFLRLHIIFVIRKMLNVIKYVKETSRKAGTTLSDAYICCYVESLNLR